MPGHAGSPYWAAVDFDSEGEDDQMPPSHRVYLDPWDNDAFGMIHGETPDSSQGENFNSFVGEPVSASFYYVPTKNYDSSEDFPSPIKRIVPPEEVPEYSIYGRKSSKLVVSEFSMPVYNTRPISDRRRSLYIEEPLHAPHPMVYETPYAYLPQPSYMPVNRSRMSLIHQQDFAMSNFGHGKHRRPSRMADAYEQSAYESLSPEYEDWARPFPKTAPDNFHLSRYGHLQIDYSCSWNSLDRLIRNQ